MFFLGQSCMLIVSLKRSAYNKRILLNKKEKSSDLSTFALIGQLQPEP